jgi:hypothetical protein
MKNRTDGAYFHKLVKCVYPYAIWEPLILAKLINEDDLWYVDPIGTEELVMDIYGRQWRRNFN